jgi:hypothetical protein
MCAYVHACAKIFLTLKESQCIKLFIIFGDVLLYTTVAQNSYGWMPCAIKLIKILPFKEQPQLLSISLIILANSSSTWSFYNEDMVISICFKKLWATFHDSQKTINTWACLRSQPHSTNHSYCKCQARNYSPKTLLLFYTALSLCFYCPLNHEQPNFIFCLAYLNNLSKLNSKLTSLQNLLWLYTLHRTSPY